MRFLAGVCPIDIVILKIEKTNIQPSLISIFDKFTYWFHDNLKIQLPNLVAICYIKNIVIRNNR